MKLRKFWSVGGHVLGVPLLDLPLPPGSRHPPGGMCDSVHGGVSASVHAGIPHTPPGADTPLGADTHPQSRHPPRSRQPPGADPQLEQIPPLEQTPTPPRSRHPPLRACWEIRSMRGRYASY